MPRHLHLLAISCDFLFFQPSLFGTTHTIHGYQLVRSPKVLAGSAIVTCQSRFPFHFLIRLCFVAFGFCLIRVVSIISPICQVQLDFSLFLSQRFRHDTDQRFRIKWLILLLIFVIYIFYISEGSIVAYFHCQWISIRNHMQPMCCREYCPSVSE